MQEKVTSSEQGGTAASLSGGRIGLARDRFKWLIGLGIAVAIMTWLLRSSESLLYLLVLLLFALGVALLVLSPMLVLIVHHLAGRLLGGWLAGFRFERLDIGPFRLANEGGRLRLRRCIRNRALHLSILLLPVGDHDLVRRWSCIMATGLVMSFLLALFATIAVTTPVLPSVLRPAFIVITIWSWVYFAVSTIPGRRLVLASPGAKLAVLRKGGPRAERLAALLCLLAEIDTNKRARDWNIRLLSCAVAPEDGSFEEAYANLLAYGHYIDRREIDQAQRCLERALSLEARCPAWLRTNLLAAATFFYAFHREDATLARKWWEQFAARIDRLRLINTERLLLVLQVEAAMYLAAGQYVEAFVTAREGIAAAERSRYPNLARMVKDDLRAIIARAETEMTEPQVPSSNEGDQPDTPV